MRLLLVFTLFFFNNVFSQDWKKDLKKREHAEVILKELDLKKLKIEFQEKTNISDENLDLFFEHQNSFIHNFQITIFEQVILSQFSSKNIPSSYNELLTSLLKKYKNFDETQYESDLKIVKPTNQIEKTIGCDNVDFENGTTSGWNTFNGSASTAINPSGLTPGSSRITIMTGAGYDNIIGGTILPVVAPGGNFSVRLEDQSNGANASRLSQTFTVNSANAVFTYKFATVLEDGTHSVNEQAYFKARIKDQNGVVLDCVYDSLTPTFPYTGLINSSNVYYKNWTTRTILLGNYIGQNITIEFTAQDCTQTGHLGYAYIDGACLPLQITASSLVVCPGIGVNLSAPGGYDSYSWTGPGIVGSSTTQNIVANQPGNYQVNVTSGTCNSPVFITLTGGGIQSTTEQICSGDTTTLEAPVGFSTYSWSGPGIIGATDTSFVLVDEPGVYNLSITGGTGSLCSSTYTLDSIILPNAGADLTICQGDTVQLNVTGGSTVYQWTPDTLMINPTTANPSVYPIITTSYIATTCGVKDTIDVIVINSINAVTTGDVLNCNRNGVPIGIIPSGNGDYSYSWSPSDDLDQTNTSSVIASPHQTQVYTVTVSLGNSCQYVDSIKITVPMIASFDATPIQDSICLGSSVQLNAIYQKECGINGTACSGSLSSAQLGTGSSVSNTTNTTIYNGTALSSKFQILITKAELNALGIISGNTFTDLGFNIAAVAGSNIYQNFSIKMTCTNDLALTTTFQQDLLEVFTPKNVILNLGVNYYTLDNTFDWDGNTNILIEICYQNSSISTNSSITFTPTTFSSFLAKTSASACNEVLGVLSSNRPNLYFKYCTSPPLSAISYIWSPALGLDDDEISNPTATPLVSTKYIVTAIDTVSTCVFIDSVQLVVGNLFNVSLEDSIVNCNFLGTSLNPIISLPGNYSYQWTPNTFLSDQNSQNPIASPITTTEYKLTVTNDVGCSIKDSVKLVVVNLATFYVTPIADSICNGQSVQFNSFYQKGCGVNGSLCSGASSSVQIGTAASTSSSNSITIYKGSFNGSKTQILFKNTELNAAGITNATTLSHLGFNISSIVGNNIYQNFTIKMSCTSLNALTTTFEGNLQTVFNPKNVILSNGVNYYTFDNNFDWDGTSNLIVEICYNNASLSSNSSVFYSGTTYNSVNYTTGSLVCGNLTGTIASNRPNTYFKHCSAQANGSLDFQWSPSIGLNNDSIANPIANPSTDIDYTVTATDTTNGCVFNDIISIHTSQNKILNLGNDSLICQGIPFSLNAKSGFDSYLWNDGSTDSIKAITNAGLYWVRVTNSCGTQRDTCIITINNELNNLDLGNDTIICSGLNINLDVYNPNYFTYIWQDGSSDSIVTVLDSGLYWVRVSDQCGSKIDSIYLSLETITPINLGNDTILCPSNMLALNIENNYDSIVWSTGSNNDSIIVNSVGTYSVIASNICGVMKDTITVQFDVNPQVYLGNDTLICETSSLNLIAQGCDSCNYSWQDNSTNINFDATNAGIYYVTASNDCGSKRDSIIISTLTPNPFSLGNDTILCNSNTLVLDPGINYISYFWSNGSNLQTNEITSAGGEITLRTVNTCGEFFDTINVQYESNPTVSLGNDTLICENSTLNLVAQGCDSCNYSWQDNSTNINFDATNAGIYHVTAINDCGSKRDSIIISTLTPNPFNLGNDTTLCNPNTLVLDPENQYLSYFWSDGSNLQTNEISSPGGEITLRTINSCGEFFDTIIISYETNPTLNLGEDTVLCDNISKLLTAGSCSTCTYIWQDNSNNPTFLADSLGLFFVTVTNLCGTSKDSILITNNGLIPLADLGPDTSLCFGNTAIIQTVYNSSYSYLWQNGNINSFLNVTNSGTYWVKVSNSCTSVYDTINVIEIYTPPVVDLGNDTLICEGDFITLSTANEYLNYFWQNGSTNQSLTILDDGVYWLYVQDTNNCYSNKDSIIVSNKEFPFVNLGPDQIICEGKNIFLEVLNTNYSYIWQNGSTSNFFNVDNAGTYTVYATNQCGTYSESVKINFKNCACSIDVPSAFSPNDDLSNDILLVRGNCVTDLNFYIFNRWGEQVFESHNLTDGWDGTFKNEEMDPDIFYYVLDAKIDNEFFKKEGSVSLVK